MLDWLRIWPELVRLNFQKARHRRRLAGAGPAPGPAPCQCPSDSGRALVTRCEACLRLDRGARYRFVCPEVRSTPDGPFCGADSAAIRPRWGHALARLASPPLALLLLSVLGAWLFLRVGSGLGELPLADVAWPPRWPNIAEHRRARFRDLALRSLAAGDVRTASVALFSAIHTGKGDPAENRALARLATLGGYHSLTDEVHAANLALYPARATEFALAWHDDLLIANRPAQLARLALNELTRPGAPREFWLRAFFESIRHPRVARDLLDAQPPVVLPHPGLRPALAAAAALEARNHLATVDDLLALRGALPGDAARRFLVLAWLEAGEPVRARFAAIDPGHPSTPGEIALLTHLLLRASGETADARTALRPVFSDPALRPSALAALVRDPDPVLLLELAAALTPAERKEPRLLAALWLAARRAGLPDLAAETAAALAALGQPLSEELKLAELTRPATGAFNLAAAVLPLDREVLYALREPLAQPRPVTSKIDNLLLAPAATAPTEGL